METVWNLNQINSFSSLSTPKTYDIAIVGGGLTALLTTFFLKDSNLNIGVFSNKNFTQSASARSNAKITTVNTTLYSDIAEFFGPEKAKFFHEDKHKAMCNYIQIIKENNIECDLDKTSSYLYSTTEKGEKKIIKEMGFFNEIGVPFVHHKETLENIIPIKNAYEFTNEYSFNPIKFMESLILILKKYKNIDFYDNSPVTKITNSYLISNYHKVNFKTCVTATQFPPFKLLGQFPFKMHQEKATLATFTTSTPLKNMYVSVDDNNLSYRPLNENTMILVGNNHHTGEESITNIDLYTYVKKTFKDVNNFKTYSNQDCITFDGLPFVDKACIFLPNVYIATGYNLFGITTSMLSAKHISQNILYNTKLPKLYSRNRFKFSAQKQGFFRHIKTVIYEFFHRYNFSDGITKETIENLKDGEGFTFLHRGRNLGVSKQNGKLIFVINRCPHLGCPLHFNSVSNTWDCRCHGSSFNPKGEYIFSPTNKNLELFDFSRYKISANYKE